MRHNYSIGFGEVSLLPLTEETSEQYRQLRNQDGIRKWFVSSAVISRQQQEQWFRDYLNDDNDIMFSIHLNNAKGTFVGANAVYHIRKDEKVGEYGRIAVMPEFSKQGIGYFATMAACVFAKRILKMEQLDIEVNKHNTVAIKTYLRAGFVYCDGECGETKKEMIRMIQRL